MSKLSALPVEKDCIMYNTVMASTVAEDWPEDGVSVMTTDGKRLQSDAVVITAPLGYLKRHKDSIRPLDDRLSKAIDSISYGRLEKVSQ